MCIRDRPGPPRISDADLTDVLTTLTPTEFAGHGDWVSCEHRPSRNAPEARRLLAFNITRLIGCGSSSFRPVGSLPGLLNPLQPCGWTGTWPFRREPPNSTGGTLTREHRTLRGQLRSEMFIAHESKQDHARPPESPVFKENLSSAACAEDGTDNRYGEGLRQRPGPLSPPPAG